MNDFTRRRTVGSVSAPGNLVTNAHRLRTLAVSCVLALVACSPDIQQGTADFGFDGTCVSCHLGLSSGHTHPNYKLRCIDCHGGNDQIEISADVTKIANASATDPGKFRDKALLAQVHVAPKPGLARFFFANGIDD